MAEYIYYSANFPSRPTKPATLKPCTKRERSPLLHEVELASANRILAGRMQAGDFNAPMWFDSIFGASSIHHERSMLCRDAGPRMESLEWQTRPQPTAWVWASRRNACSCAPRRSDSCLLHGSVIVISKWQKLNSPLQQKETEVSLKSLAGGHIQWILK